MVASWGARRSDLNPFGDKPKDEHELKDKLEGYFSHKYKTKISLGAFQEQQAH